MAPTAVAPVVVSSVLLVAAIVLAVTLATTLVHQVAALARVREQFRQELEASKALLTIEEASSDGVCVYLRLANRGSRSTIIDERATVLVDYYTQDGLRRVEVLLPGASWFAGGRPGSSPGASSGPPVVELRPGGSAEVVLCPSGGLDATRPVTVVIVSRHGVRAEYVYSRG